MKNLIRWFRELPYELVGGTIGLSICFLFYVLHVFSGHILGLIRLIGFPTLTVIWFYTEGFITLIAFPVSIAAWRFIWGDNYSPFYSFAGILNFVLWFILGCIAGWIIKKVRNKKRLKKFIILIFILIPIMLLAIFLYTKINSGEFKEDIQYEKFDISIGELNEQKCEELEDKSQVFYCLEIVAKNKKDLSICDKISDDFTKDGCYWQVNKMEYSLEKASDIDIYKKWCPYFKSDFYKGRCNYIFIQYQELKK